MTSADHAGLGPCVQDPTWVKMSSPTPVPQKTKRKPDGKPSSQTNKCLNEKRRREQENTYIEELSELIRTSINSEPDMHSAKSDKCAILRETVDKIKKLNEAEVPEEAVQQGEVSSSRQTLLQNRLLAPLMLQALDGFFFLLTTEGKIELVSDNVCQYIKFSPEDLVGKDINNFIHVGDTNKFSTSLKKSIGWTSDPSSDWTRNRSRSFTCRLLVKPPDDLEQTMEEKQQRTLKFEQMQISTVFSSYSGDRGDSDDSPDGEGLLCISRRIPVTERQGPPIEQFTTKLDAQGVILNIDSTNISPPFRQYLAKEDKSRRRFVDFCHPNDVGLFTNLLQEARKAGQASSDIYKLKFGPDRCVEITTKCTYFQNSSDYTSNEPFYMAMHSILSSPPEGGTSNSTSGSVGATPTTLLDETPHGSTRVKDEIGSSPGALDRNSPFRHLLLSQDGNTDIGATEDSHSEAQQPQPPPPPPQQQQNKILKGLLQKEDDDPSSTVGRIYTTHMQLQSQHSNSMNHLQNPSFKNNSNSEDEMLRNLLTDDEEVPKEDDNEFLYNLFKDDKKDKMSMPSDFGSHTKEEKSMKGDIRNQSILHDGKEEKISIKTEFISTASPVTGHMTGPFQSNVRMSPSSSPTSGGGAHRSTHSSTPPNLPVLNNASFSHPPRSSGSDLQTGLPTGMLRGVKRPNDEAHEGNPTKQVNIPFCALVDSPPMTGMSPASTSLGGPPTPIQRSTTPLGRPNTPHGRPNTPHGRPNTPHSGRPTTPHGSSSVSLSHPQQHGMSPMHVGAPTSMAQSGGMVGQSIAGPYPNNSPSLSMAQQKYQQQHLQMQHLQDQKHQHLNHPQRHQSLPPITKKDKKDKNLLALLEKNNSSDPLTTMIPTTRPSPYALPQEKLPKDISQKVNTTSRCATSTINNSAAPFNSNQGGEILGHLLQQPTTTRPSNKMSNTGIPVMRLSDHQNQEMLVPQNSVSLSQQVQRQPQQQQPQISQQVLSKQQQQQQQQQVGGAHPHLSQQLQQQGHLQIGGTSQNNLVTSLSTIPSSGVPAVSCQTSKMNNNMSYGTVSSIGSTNTTILPSFAHSMGLNPLPHSSTILPDGHLPSITSATSIFCPETNDNLPDEVFNDILDLESTYSDKLLDGIQHTPSSSSSPFENEKLAIQQIHNDLIEEFEPQQNSLVSNSMTFSTFSTSVPVNSVTNYPPPYTQRGRFPSPASGGGSNSPHMSNSPIISGGGGAGNPVLRQMPGGGQHFSSGNQQVLLSREPMQKTHQRISQMHLQHNESIKSRLPRQQQQRQQQQQLHVSGSVEVSQPPAPSYQNLDDLMNNGSVGSNINVGLGRSVSSEPQSSPSYGVINSPLGNGSGGQVSPGQRISQPSFSPHNQLPSPLSNSQQYPNNSGMGQMGGYQNTPNSQLSPNLSQNSPVGTNYSGGGSALLPQMSPTGHPGPGGPVAPGQHSPAWSGSSPQHRPSMQQSNPILTAHLNVMNAGNRNYTGSRPVQLPSMRTYSSPGSRQSPYSLGGGQDINAFAPSSPQGSQNILYQQQQQAQGGPQNAPQQQQPIRLSRTMSVPGQMPGNPAILNPTRDRLRDCLEARTTGGAANNPAGRATSPSVNQPHPQLQHGPPHQRQQMQSTQQQVPTSVARQPQQQQQTNYQPIDHQHQHIDGFLSSLSSDGSTWNRDNVGGVPQNNTSVMPPSPRLDDIRGNNNNPGQDKSVLKRLLTSKSPEH